MTALAMKKPMVILKKSKSSILQDGVLQTEVFSFTKNAPYQLTLKIIKVRAKKHCYLDPMPDSRTNEVKNRTKKYKGFSQ